MEMIIYTKLKVNLSVTVNSYTYHNILIHSGQWIWFEMVFEAMNI